MGLMDLLTVGTSISSIEDKPNRYKMSGDVYLPNFSNAKKTKASVRSDGRKASAAPSSQETENLEIFSEPRTAQPNLEPVEKPAMNAIAEPMNHASNAPCEVVPPRPAFPKGRWTVFKNPFKRDSESARMEEPVQSELSLELVHPVRNDLNENDLESFEVGLAGTPQGEHPAEPASTTGKPAALWGRITRTFFKSAK